MPSNQWSKSALVSAMRSRERSLPPDRSSSLRRRQHHLYVKHQRFKAFLGFFRRVHLALSSEHSLPLGRSPSLRCGSGSSIVYRCMKIRAFRDIFPKDFPQTRSRERSLPLGCAGSGSTTAFFYIRSLHKNRRRALRKKRERVGWGISPSRRLQCTACPLSCIEPKACPHGNHGQRGQAAKHATPRRVHGCFWGVGVAVPCWQYAAAD